jgi:F-type H+-transporting ATPase subunit b
MEETLRQLGRLLLGSIPTIILLTSLYLMYKSLVHNRLEAVLAERHSRTEGAIEKARADIAAAEARTQEYEQRLRDARVSVFKLQEARRQQTLRARMDALAQARALAQQKVLEARTTIEQDKVAAQTGLQAESVRLAAEIVRTVLQPVRAARTPVPHS